MGKEKKINFFMAFYICHKSGVKISKNGLLIVILRASKHFFYYSFCFVK